MVFILGNTEYVTPSSKMKSKTLCLCNQIQTFSDKISSKHQCGFRKGFMIKNKYHREMKKSLDNGGAFDTLLTDLSKAFDSLKYAPLKVRLWFDIKSMRLFQYYLSNRKQRIKTVNAYS